MNLTVDVQENEGKSVVLLAGEIDAYTAPKLKEALLSLTEKEGNKVEVNLEQVNYMDSTGLGVFVSGLKSTKENNSELKLVQLQDRVYRLFEITGLIDVIDVDKTVQGGY
ncbi:anti-sigma factor antagonist [Terribacillus saccharophilus]|uniref:Anti-sigma factor antagonist n=1 Tax=Terribacillus saccharophilus TaxID=361277 RepID=A0A268HEC6_9BACI|nr:anti-sigma factor antagonist [Terribacillus saccharophilus]PAD20200.1 anti-anti-sigma factor [Terribacillus saccharophilus]PAE08213.1 anti-anti-sigma factor [Terribacillus saccharophilus]PAF18359.1 anti-anti-sigma factor [Terribacillus saccharophilus]PAF20865.1 anti-anti-sigma factor [Terribacillus saccharophilus]PAF35744.1 anti-anti-sigma factor [Terribacillus saccharophilus]